MKKVFLYAYDAGNLGDDLFVDMIVRRYPDVQFYMWDNHEKNNYAEYPNLIKIDDRSIVFRFLYYIRSSFGARYKNYCVNQCDAVVYIGGSIFMEYPNWKEINSWWDYQAEHSKFFALGANFGPYQLKEYRESMAKIYSKMEDVCFRDRYSADLFKEVPTVRYAPDILFGYHMPQINKKQKKVFVSVINCHNKGEGHSQLKQYADQYEEWLLQMLKHYIDSGNEIVLSSFCEKEGDAQVVDLLYKKLKEYNQLSDIKTCCYNGLNKKEVLQELAESELVVASRFHATILGMAARCKVLPIIYSDKTKHVLEDIGFKGYYMDIRKIDMRYKIEEINKMAFEKEKILKENANKHFEKLDYLLISGRGVVCGKS